MALRVPSVAHCIISRWVPVRAKRIMSSRVANQPMVPNVHGASQKTWWPQ